MIREIFCVVLLCVLVIGAYVVITDMFREAPSEDNNKTEPIYPHMTPWDVGSLKCPLCCIEP